MDMKNETRVLIVEDDPFAENWMALLLARDWRTRVVGEAGSLEGMVSLSQSMTEPPDLILFSASLLTHPFDPRAARLRGALADLPGKPLIMLAGRSAGEVAALHAAEVREADFPRLCGLILKKEICYALGWAIALADHKQWVITPGMETYLRSLGQVPHTLVLDGRKPVHNLTDHEADVARLALIFSMERRELSDEIKITADWSYGLVSSIYRKLGMEEILSGEVDPEEYLGRQFAENPRFKDVLKQALKSRKKNDLETLAFHILSMPEIRDLS
jgi:DNA-binding NarL/FixJ family response regulator